MKKDILIIGTLALLAACSAPVEMQVQVKPLGEDVSEAREAQIYYLPRTVLMVELGYEEIRDFPGPYGEYAGRYLGLEDVIRKKDVEYRITEVKVNSYQESDPDLAYRVHVKEGDLTENRLAPYMKRGVISDGSMLVHQDLAFSTLRNGELEGSVSYLDLGNQSNFGERTETMYKTLVTDTSFVKVPVTRTIMEEKSRTKKAEEAADFILELRTRRFEMLTGELDLYPEGEAMAAALKKMDELEASYLTLFTGKTISGKGRKAWFVIPVDGQAASSYNLDIFDPQLGFVPEELGEGLPLTLSLEAEDINSEIYARLASDTVSNNLLFYRIPVVADLEITWGSELLMQQRISVFQSGSIISAPF